MKSKWTLLGSILAVLLLALAAGLTQAQGPEPPGEGVQPEGEAGVQAAVGARIPIQGRLTDASGNPLNGSYDIEARIYDANGTALCSVTQVNVNVSNGLFNMDIPLLDLFGCPPSIINGQELSLGITVEGEEMSPRQPIYPVPYAFSLKPGAIISDTMGGAPLNVYNHGSGWGLDVYSAGHDAVHGRTGSSNHAGVAGVSWGSGIGVYGESATGVAIRAAGTGVIKSTADTQIAVSPLKMVPRYDADVTLRAYYDGKMEIRPNSLGTYYVIVPVDLPNLLFGTAMKLKSIQVCYLCDDTLNYITHLYVGWRTDAGYNDVINDPTDRNATTWTCYTVEDSTPEAIAGPVYIDFGLDFNLLTPPGPDIQIGKIILTLTEQ